MKLLSVLLATLAVTFTSFGSLALAEDWPTWRYDAGRNATSPEQLADKLHLQWTRGYAAPVPAWPEDPRLMFDASYQPVVMGHTLFLASAQNDSVTAIDTRTGEEKWQFFTEGPVRFAPVASQGRVYFGADDGRVYCLDGESGSLLWKFDAATSARKVIGNDRLISVWPVRGGPVLSEGKLYFTVGVWPFEGTFLYTLDAESGDVLSRKGQSAPPQAKATTLTNMTPQGYLVVSEDRLFIPCGRAAAGVYDIPSGSFRALNYRARGLTDYHVTATGPWLFHGHRVIDMKEGRALPINAPRPVTSGSEIYIAQGENVVAADLLKQGKGTPAKDGQPAQPPKFKAMWHVKGEQILAAIDPENKKQRVVGPMTVDLKAGNRVYGRIGNVVYAAEAPSEGKKAHAVWATKVDGTPTSLIVADGRLFVATREGKILCFGADIPELEFSLKSETVIPLASPGVQRRVKELLAKTKSHSGFCLVWGVDDGKLIREILRRSDLRVVAIDTDAEKIGHLRKKLNAEGLYGERVLAMVGDPIQMALPPYMANLIVSENVDGLTQGDLAALAKQLFHPLRPYGGTAALALSDEQHESFESLAGKLTRSKVERFGELTLLSRDGALEGAANWSHEYGDPSNTLMSKDTRVKLPLGVLWFGGPASDTRLFFDRHFWGPSLTVIDGRMFLQGHTDLAAVDIYTGRILWNKKIVKGSSPGRRGNFYDGTDHLGYHFCAVEDGVYLAYADKCLRIDPTSGKTLSEFKLESPTGKWGRIRVWNNLLIVSVFDEKKLEGSVPTKLVAFDRYKGNIVWSHDPVASCPVVAIGKKHLYYYDGHLKDLYNDIGRKGAKGDSGGVPKAGDERAVRAIDAATGIDVWRKSTPLVITWLAYNGDHDVLVVSNHEWIQARRGQSGEVLWDKSAKSKGFQGHPESRWDRVILWKDRIIDQRGPGLQYFLETGKPIQMKHPISGEPVDWEFTQRGHHCNYAIANEHMMTFRAGSAGFADMKNVTTGRFNGFRTGCRNSLIPAGGILNAPNFAHGCSCSFELFTSLALTHVPEMDAWSYNAMGTPKGPIKKVGINLAAPGDRVAENGTLWLDYPQRGKHGYLLPNVSGPSPDVPVEMVVDKPRWFRQHPTQISGEEKRWVGASGVEGLKSLKIALGKEASQSSKYQVRLYFSEPDDVKVGERLFEVKLGGKTVLDQFDVVKEAQGRNRVVMKQFDEVLASDTLQLELTSIRGRPLLCGVEIIALEK